MSPRHVLHRKGTVAQNGATSILHAAVVPAEGATLDVRDGSPVVPHFGGMKIEFTIILYMDKCQNSFLGGITCCTIFCVPKKIIMDKWCKIM